MSDQRRFGAETYLNPVYSKSFPDPFVLKHAGEYFAYCTGFAPDGRVFGVLRSSDLVNWTEVGSAMAPLGTSPPYYWAPEVVYHNGRFYLYYSVGNEVLMEIRVAVSDRPDGDFVDSGKRLTFEEFAIDAHVFIDDGGARYMFYATDFLEHTHIGTGTVVDRMIDWYTLEGNPRPVTRARYDWQVYDPQRKEKGGVRWHTVEGPAVLKRKGLYYEMFSGGNWQNTSYGVSFAVTDDLHRPDEWLQFSDGENVLPILRTIPDIVVGPGHNSIVRGPNNRELYCVYHRWTDAGRVMAVDRMDFAGSRIFVTGATNTPQPEPFRPSIREKFHGESLAAGLALNGSWNLTGDGAISDAASQCEVRFKDTQQSFLLELTWNVIDAASYPAKFSIALDEATEIAFDAERNTVSILTSGRVAQRLALPNDFDWSAVHRARAEVDHRRCSIEIDDRSVRLEARLPEPPNGLAIKITEGSVALVSIELTEGFEELFEDPEFLANSGWTFDAGGDHRIEGGELVFDSELRYVLSKGGRMDSVEFAANVRTLDRESGTGTLGLLLHDDSAIFRLMIDIATRTIEAAGDRKPVPSNIDLSQHHQLRLIKIGGHATAYFDDVEIGEFSIDDRPVRCAVASEGVRSAIEMIRLTAL